MQCILKYQTSLVKAEKHRNELGENTGFQSDILSHTQYINLLFLFYFFSYVYARDIL